MKAQAKQNNRIVELEDLIRRSLKISDLWRPPEFATYISNQQAEEYTALETMYQQFKQAVNQ